MLRFLAWFMVTAQIVTLTTVHIKWQRELQKQERDYLYQSAMTYIRTYVVNKRILEKKIVQLRKDLGDLNDELNPYE